MPRRQAAHAKDRRRSAHTTSLRIAPLRTRSENDPQPFLRVFVSPAALCALGFLAAMAAVLQYSLRAYVPGSLDVGGLHARELRGAPEAALCAGVPDTVWICFLTAFFTLLLGYPLAYALVRTHNVVVKSTILVITVTPLFLGEVVRTYSWIIVLGNNGFLNAMLLKAGVIEQPLQIMFTTFGVVVALVHVTLPVMVIMLAAALSHIDRDYERAAASLGAGPVRAFLTVTLPLSTPGIIAGVTTAFAWTFSAFATPQLIGGGQVNMVSNLVYQLGFASFNFPVRGEPVGRRAGAHLRGAGAAAPRGRGPLGTRSGRTDADARRRVASQRPLGRLEGMPGCARRWWRSSVFWCCRRSWSRSPPSMTARSCPFRREAWSLRWFAKALAYEDFPGWVPQRSDRHRLGVLDRARGRRGLRLRARPLPVPAQAERSRRSCSRRWWCRISRSGSGS